eukprot:10232436-Karenia_brevis.AAC.1
MHGTYQSSGATDAKHHVDWCVDTLFKLRTKFSFRWDSTTSHFAAHVPRADNVHADSLANMALDDGMDLCVWHTEAWQCFIWTLVDPQFYSMALVANFDGASRGNPGAAACGGVVKLLGFDEQETVKLEIVLWE